MDVDTQSRIGELPFDKCRELLEDYGLYHSPDDLADMRTRIRAAVEQGTIPVDELDTSM